MKKFLFILALFGGVFLSIPAFAVERIDSFDATIQIREDSAIEVSERIEYDFGQALKRGIFRDIPIKYKARGGNYNLRISDISVADEKGAAYKFTTSYPGNNVQIKIGDPNVEITGKHTYVINYTIKRAINYFSDHDELYWNITGNEWTLAIGSASAKVILPQKIESQNIQTDCFAGLFGSTQKCNSILKGLGQTDSVSFSENQLSAGEGLTIVAGIPKGIVVKPSAFETALDTARDNWIVILPLITLAVCFYLWYTRGRDPAGRGIIIAQYDPPDNLTPAEVGTIVDEHAQNKDITAEIIYLATQGYLKIKQIKVSGLVFGSKDYEIELIKTNFTQLNYLQQLVLDGIFGVMKEPNQIVRLSSLKNKFYDYLIKTKNEAYHSLVEKGYFTGNPNKIRGIFVVIGAVLIVGAFFLGKIFGNIGIISLVVSGIIVILFGIFMPARTKKGVEAKEHILGLKLYMSVAEARRLKFHNAPEKKPEQFEKLLPYAMVLGVEKQWAKRFEGIYNQEPNWYNGPVGTSFNAMLFTSALSDFSGIANSVLASNPSSTAASGGSGFGGGFGGGGSGGGFGGGGGGSW